MKFKAGPLKAVAGVCAAVLLLSTAALAQEAEGPPQRVIVKWKNSNLSVAARSASATQSMDRAGSRMGVSMRRLRTVATGAEVVGADRRLSRTELNDLINTLQTDPNVEYAEEDVLQHHTFTPNDPRYAEQWGYFESAGGLNLPAAWDIVTGTGVKVAILDTGYRPHADLVGNIVGGYDFISDTFVSRDGNGRDADPLDPGDWNSASDCPPYPATSSSWHGTHVAGTVAAVTNNSVGVAGVAYGAKVVPIRVLGRCGGLTSDISDAIIWAAGGSVSGVPANPNPARIISMSLGSSPDNACSSTEQSAINTARSLGAVVVVAAGNDNINANRESPGNCSGVIVVAAVGRSGGKAAYSNFGAVVDVAAPGGSNSASAADDILSTLNTGTTAPGADAYAFYAGTSMATPHVSGVVALMLSRNNELTVDDIESRLKASTRAFPATCSQCGTGIVDALAAVNAAVGGGSTPGGCPTGYTSFSGTLSSRTSAYAPSTSGVAANAGVLSGRLTGPASGADFDLYLQRRSTSGSSWTTVAASEGTTSTEAIDYSASTARTFRWRVFAYSGSGAYSLCIKTP